MWVSETPRSLARAAPWIVFGVAVLAYVQMLWGEFVYDDFPFIVQNPAVHTLARPWKFLVDRAAMSEGGAYTIFRPLASWCFSLTWAVAPDRPAAFHFVNLVAHGLAGVCVWRLGCAVGLRAAGGALWAALVFVIHPVQTEAVAWIAGLGNPLFVIGVTSACVAWLRWRVAGAPHTVLAAGAGWYVFALLGKEHAAALPLLVLIIEWALRGAGLRPLRERAMGFAGVCLMTVAYVAWRDYVLGRTGQVGYFGGAFGPTLLTTVVGFRTYLRLLVWPTNLHPEYIVPIRTGLAAPGVWPSILTLAALAAGAVLIRRRAPRVALGVAWWFAALVPVANIIPMKTIINERLLYLPLIGFALVLGVAWDAAPRRWWRVALAAQLAVFAVLTTARTRDWLTNERLWTTAVRAEPRGYTSHYNLGQVYLQQEKSEAALREFDQAIALRGEFPYAEGASGVAWMQLGEYRGAVHAFRRGLRTLPDDRKLQHNLVQALVQWGDASRADGRAVVAEGAYREALQWDPAHAGARAGLRALGREEGAE